MQKLQLLLLELYRKYNDLVIYHVISLPFYGIIIILNYWFTGDLSASRLLTLFICALYLPPVYFVNKKEPALIVKNGFIALQTALITVQNISARNAMPNGVSCAGYKML